MEGFTITPTFLSQIGVVSETVLILLLIVFDKGLTLKSRVKDRDDVIFKLEGVIEKQDETINWQRETLTEKDRQIADLTRAAQMTALGFQKFGQAAEQVVAGSDGP